MKRYFVGLDVSKDETALCLRDDRGEIVASFKKLTDPDVLLRALSKDLRHIVCVVPETSRMANWLYDELSQRGLPMVCIDARQAHAVLSQMHSKAYIPMRRGFFYLVAIMDWYSRKLLAWRLPNSMDAEFCVEALKKALAMHGTPEIFNADSHMMVTSSAAAIGSTC